MVKKAEIPDHVIDSALRLAAEKGWRDLSLAEIAAAAKLPLAKVYAVFSSKQAILSAFSRRIDAQILAEAEPDSREGTARDRLFDVLMRRFDALGPHKAAIHAIVRDVGCDPLMGLCAAAQFRRSLACMLEAADLSAEGLRGALRIKILGAVYVASLRVWLRDDSPDMARTMAAVDRHLRRVEWLAACCSRAGRSRRRGAEAAA